MSACEDVNKATVMLPQPHILFHSGFPLIQPARQYPRAGFQKWCEREEAVALAVTRARPPSITPICGLLHSLVDVYSAHPLPLRDDLSVWLYNRQKDI